MNNTMNNSEKLESLRKRQKNIKLVLESATDRKERYADLMNRVTFSKKKPERQSKILRRYTAAEKLEIERYRAETITSAYILKDDLLIQKEKNNSQ